MATNSNWTVVFEDKCVIKNTGAEKGTGYVINDDAFWATTDFQNIWAIQSGTSNSSDEVEYKDETTHSSYIDANLGDISQFSDKWDSVHLTELQSDWDNDNVDGETDAEKHIADHIRKKCSELYNKKFKERYCAYTMVARTTPMVHKDLDDYTSHQILLYIRGDESLHRGTGFYVKNKNTKDTYELNTHIGFKENRAIFWESSSYHSPLMWDDKNQSKRFSILAQYKEI